MKVATLGPAGTCSEDATAAYIRDRGWSLNESLLLTDTFEAAVEKVLTGAVDQAVVPAAYMNFHDLVFRNLGQLQVHEILYSQTPIFVLAGRRGQYDEQQDGHVYKIACHHAPVPLIEKLRIPAEWLDASSNASAAWMASDGRAELCITQLKAVEVVNLQSPPERRLEVIDTFGSVGMVWVVFERGGADCGRPFWRGHFNR